MRCKLEGSSIKVNNEKRKILYSDSSLWVEDGHQAVCDDCDWTVPRGEAGCMLRAVCAACVEVCETSQDLQLFVSSAMKARRAVEAAGLSESSSLPAGQCVLCWLGCAPSQGL